MRNVKSSTLPAVLIALAVAVGTVTLLSRADLGGSLPRLVVRGGLPWPRHSQGAVAVDGAGITTSGRERATPIASVAKVMTAYLFLLEHPLRPGADGPEFSISTAEADRYGSRRAAGESLLPVHAGERLNEREALEALLTVSANNVADEIARWTAGDRAVFVRRMNDTAGELGMRDTLYTDPSGLDAGTVSTPTDQILLLRAAVRLPGFLEAASRPSFQGIPTTDQALGRGGIIAGKTGHTSSAGGNFVFVALAHRGTDAIPTLIYGAVLGHRDAALSSALTSRMSVALAKATAAGGVASPRRTAAADQVQALLSSGALSQGT